MNIEEKRKKFLDYLEEKSRRIDYEELLKYSQLLGPGWKVRLKRLIFTSKVNEQ